MKIPIYFRPFAAKREIERLAILAAKTEAVQSKLSAEIQTRIGMESKIDALNAELYSANEKLAAVSKWIIVSHGLAHVRTAGGKPMDILKKKNENPIRVNLPSPFPKI